MDFPSTGGRSSEERRKETGAIGLSVSLVIVPPVEGKDNRSSGVPFNWLSNNMSGVPNGATEQTVERYARAYMWYLLCQVVFSDCSGNNCPWMYVDFLRDWDAGYSWGSAALAYLYRQVVIGPPSFEQ